MKPTIAERPHRNHMTDRDKAAYIVGMMWAFQCVGWPSHFSANDKVSWERHYRWAEQMLTGGVFNPLHAWRVINLANEELCLPYATD